jgi:hypothetical protein
MPSMIKAVTWDASDALSALGATVVREFDSHTVLQDPEGNEFCVELGPGDLGP